MTLKLIILFSLSNDLTELDLYLNICKSTYTLNLHYIYRFSNK